MIIITYPEIIQNEHEWIRLFFEQGLQTLHVRKPRFSEAELKEYLGKIDQKYHNRLMLHHHIDLVEQLGLKGISFTESTKSQHAKYQGLPLKRCWSAHTIDELKQIPENIDYVFLSPLFPSISKKGYERSWQIPEFQRFLQTNPKRFDLVALGGIDHLNSAQALQLGFDDVALLGGIWKPILEGESTEDVLKILTHFNLKS